VTTARLLLDSADAIECPHASTLTSLKTHCDLAKNPTTKRGECHQSPSLSCQLKSHTEWLKRYGHFGKMPLSAALMLRAHGVESLSDLKRKIWADTPSPSERAIRLESALSDCWRVSEKIAAMFLSAITNRDLSGGLAPWSDGVDATHFVVIDSNVDLFMDAIRYPGPFTYAARRQFLQHLASHVPLDELLPGLERFNPRLVQQAFFLFMSRSNRRVNVTDCSRQTGRCEECPRLVARLCCLRRIADSSSSGEKDA
jgi:hypothetical protein